MKVILSHPTGNNFARALLRELVRNGQLYEYYTSIAIFSGDLLNKMGRLESLKDISRRQYESVLKPFTRTAPFHELGRVVSAKLGLQRLTRHESGLFSIDSVYRHMDKSVASRIKGAPKAGALALYAYEDGALESFRKAKSLGMKCIYDLPIAYWKFGRKLMKEESERLPEWSATLGGGIGDSPKKLERKDQELSLADTVVTPSLFVAESLPAFLDKRKIVISPFGSPPAYRRMAQAPLNLEAPLRVLFVGSMGQRKGLGDLFEAMRLLKGHNIELVVMGSLLARMNFYREELRDFVYEPGRSNDKVLELMRSCDILCLPSIVEGRALVMQEGMSQGLPIIITPNTGGDDLVVEGKTGFLVPIRSPERIAEKLAWCSENRRAVRQMGERAQEHASGYKWDHYARVIIESILATQTDD